MHNRVRQALEMVDLILRSTLLIGTALAFCEKEMALLFEDCDAFGRSDHFGGPVCGSDGETYPNWVYVRCKNWREGGLQVEARYSGPCSRWGQTCPYSPLYSPVCATDQRTYANVEALACAGASLGVLHEGECHWDDPCLRSEWQRWGLNPVCADNGLTYPNVAQFRCLGALRHSDLRVLHDGGCTLSEARRDDACWMARNRYEWNPLCASDDVTYPNPFVFLCYAPPDVRVVFHGECGSPTHLSCLRASERQPPEERAAAAVCGSNGETYASRDHLLCASAQDKYLWPEHEGPCTPEDDPCRQREWFLEDVSGSPVCASDGRTYVSPAAVWCAQRTNNPCLELVHDGPCIPRSPPHRETADCTSRECQETPVLDHSQKQMPNFPR